MEKGFEGNKDRYPKLHIRQSQAAIEKFINEQITPVMTKKEKTMEIGFEVGNRVRGKKFGDEYTIVEDGNKWFLKRDNGELYDWTDRTHNIVELIEPAAPFTREDFDKVIHDYPNADKFSLSSKEIWKATVKEVQPLVGCINDDYFMFMGREVTYCIDPHPHIDLIRVIENNVEITTWAKGDPLPGLKPNGSIPKEVKNLAQKMGISIKGATEAIQRLSQRGISGVEAGKQMRKALQKITEQPVNFPTTKTTERYMKMSTAKMRDDYIKERELPTTETTHTFSAELPSGEIVEMPAPGDNWTETKREEFKRGDLRVRNLDYVKYNLNERYSLPTFDKCDDWNSFKITSEGACWAKEILRPDEPILSITTWQREIPPELEEEEPHPHREPSESNHIGLEIWPGREDQQRHDTWSAIPHTHREPSSYNTRCLEAWPERDCEVE